MELILEHCAQENAEKAVQMDTDTALPTPLMDVFLKELPLLKCIIAGMGFGRRDAEDIIQDVSVQVLKHQQENMPRPSAMAWLKRVTVNKCISEYRRRERFQRRVPTMLRHQQAMDSSVLGPDGEMMQKEQTDMLRQALENLDDSLLMPLALRFFCDHNSSEIAEILHIKASSVRSRLRKARMILADTLMKGE
jgi:RNA polymerase sigma-70 factor (ECF subfamily)